MTHDDTYKYATGKINRVKGIPNVGDHACYIVAMFDKLNQQRLRNIVTEETAVWLDSLFEASQPSQSHEHR